jgi:hypothetical protein
MLVADDVTVSVAPEAIEGALLRGSSSKDSNADTIVTMKRKFDAPAPWN